MQSINGNDRESYAAQCSPNPREITPATTGYRIFRDVPELVREYVNGTETLDYGCGYGRSTKLLRSLGLNVDAVDVNDQETMKAVKTGNERYDFVFSSFTLAEIAGDEKELFDTVVEIARVMKRGGTFITIVNREDARDKEWLTLSTQSRSAEDLGSGVTGKTSNKRVSNYFWTNEDFQTAMKNAGLIVERIHEPVVADENGRWWSIEEVASPVVIYVARKI